MHQKHQSLKSIILFSSIGSLGLIHPSDSAHAEYSASIERFQKAIFSAFSCLFSETYLAKR